MFHAYLAGTKSIADVLHPNNSAKVEAEATKYAEVSHIFVCGKIISATGLQDGS